MSGWTHPPDGRVHKGPHGYYDGQYWGDLGEEGELGYVEGCLWCWRACLHSKSATFSESPEEYVALISKWYEFNPKSGDINPKREPVKIAVLYSFRDRKETPPLPRIWWVVVGGASMKGAPA